MKEILEYSIQKLEKAFLKLKEGVISAKDELDKDGVIQRFEFTFELLWKALKIFLEYQGIDVKTPRDSLKEAFRIELIEDEEIFLDMLEDRNKSSHIYDKEVSEEIFKRIKSFYIQAIEKLLEKLKEKV
ncbi:MAG: HI0074 family nucleotidyltransferase substrate-binding subunit [Candidatus Aminicenantia bacterium]